MSQRNKYDRMTRTDRKDVNRVLRQERKTMVLRAGQREPWQDLADWLCDAVKLSVRIPRRYRKFAELAHLRECYELATIIGAHFDSTRLDELEKLYGYTSSA